MFSIKSLKAKNRASLVEEEELVVAAVSVSEGEGDDDGCIG